MIEDTETDNDETKPVETTEPATHVGGAHTNDDSGGNGPPPVTHPK